MVATFSSVQRQHVLKAIAEYDERGAEAFLAAYGFTPAPGYRLVHEGRDYDARAILGVAHRYATGRQATTEEFHDDLAGVAALLRRREFDVSEPPSARPAAATRRRSVGPAAPRAASTRPAGRAPRAAEAPPAICPTCFTALPATGVCDECG